MTKKKAVEQPIATKTYILEVGQGHDRRKKKVTVPANWKITYSHAAPGSTHQPGPMVLRFYEGNKENMRALFEDVVSFRDSSIKVEEEVIKSKAETFYRDSPQGRRAMQAEMRVKVWRDPDDENQASSDKEYLLEGVHASSVAVVQDDD